MKDTILVRNKYPKENDDEPNYELAFHNDTYID
jgi:hypothetical protein